MERKDVAEGKEWTLRRAKPGDFEDVSILEEMVISHHRQIRPDYFKTAEGSYSKEEFEELLAHPCPIALVAVQNGRIVGICFGTVEETSGNSVCRPRRIAFIQDVATLPEYRGKGIARGLLAGAREMAVQAGAVSMELCVWAFNEKALGLYKKMGMKVQYYRMEQDLRNG